MTVTFLGEDPGSRSATNDKGKRSYTRAFKLSVDSPSIGPYTVGSNASLPKIGSAHPEDAAAWCVSLRVENSEPYVGWTVTAEYSSEYELAEDPTADPARITVSTEQFQRPAIWDVNSQTICNSAGDPFDPQEPMDDSRRVISIQKNVAAHPSWVLSYQDTVNSDTFAISGITYAIGTGKVQRVSISTEQSRNAITFYSLSYDIHCRRDGWLYEPLDAGFREINFAGTARINILNTGDREPVTAPVPLDGAGRQLDNPSPATCVFGSFQIYPTAPFSVLPMT